MFVPSSEVAAGFGTLVANSGTQGWTHTIQVNGEDAVRIDGLATPHTSNADYRFTYTALGNWTITNTPLASTSRAFDYDGPDLQISISGPNPVYATNARFEILKDIVAASTDLPADFRARIANL